jgi:hypothetical protein
MPNFAPRSQDCYLRVLARTPEPTKTFIKLVADQDLFTEGLLDSFDNYLRSHGPASLDIDMVLATMLAEALARAYGIQPEHARRILPNAITT